MTLKCGMNRWVSDKDVRKGEGPSEEAAYENAVQQAGWVISDLRWHAREDCPKDCDGGRLVKWSVEVRMPYTWPGWKDGREWWNAAVTLSYDVSVVCLSRKAKEALRLHATPEAKEFRMDPYQPAAGSTADVPAYDLECESATRLSFSTDFQDTGFGADTAEAQANAIARTRSETDEMITQWAMRFRCGKPCIMLLLNDNDPKVVLRTTQPPWAAIASATPEATLFCIGDELGWLVEERLVNGRFISAEDARAFWSPRPKPVPPAKD